MNKIATYAMIEQPTASRMVDRLVSVGLILRCDAEGDRRYRSHALTTKGRNAYEAVRDLAFAHTSRALDGLSQEERGVFTRTLMRIEANLSKPLPDKWHRTENEAVPPLHCPSTRIDLF